MRIWGEPFLGQLRSDFELILYDHRGVGASTRLQGPVTIREMAEDAAGLLDALELDSAHVLGISMGSMIAQELALAEPQLIRTLTLGCTYCGGPGSVHTTEQVLKSVAEAVASGVPRARDPRLLGRQRLTRLRQGRRRLGKLPGDRPAPARIARRDRSADAGMHGARHLVRACARSTLPTQMHPRHRSIRYCRCRTGRWSRELIAGAQLEIFDGRRAPVLLGAPAALGRAAARERRRACLRPRRRAAAIQVDRRRRHARRRAVGGERCRVSGNRAAARAHRARVATWSWAPARWSAPGTA